MNNKSNYLLTLLIIQILMIVCTNVSIAQLPGEIIFSKETTDNIFVDVIRLPDNNLLLLADGRIRVYKTDPLGNEIWSKSYTTDVNHRSYSFALTPDNGFVMAAGYSISSSIRDFWIIRCNSNGDTLWTRRFNNPLFNATASARQIHVTSDGNYVICGYYQTAASEYDMAMIKVSPQGDLIWQKTYGGSNWEEATDFIETSDTCYIFAGYTKSYGGVTRAAYLVKTNSNGDSLWTKTYSMNAEQWFRSICQLTDGNLIAGGWTGANVNSGDIWMIKLNAVGDTIWTKKLTSSANWRQINSLIALPTGNIAFTGYSMSSIYSSETDSGGNILWYMNYTNGTGIKIIQAIDGNFYIAGQKQVFLGSNAMFLKVYSGEPPVPVELTSFTANANRHEVILNWSTATETNNKGFVIQKSVGSRQSAVSNWESIGFVNGKGTTTEKQNYSFSDNNVSAGKYFYRLKQIDFDGTFEYSNEIEVELTQPTEFALYQNYPNPFNPSTRISWQSPVGSHQTIKVYDILGNEVVTLVNEYRHAGYHSVNWNGKDNNGNAVSSGIYTYTIKTDGFSQSKKLMLMK